MLSLMLALTLAATPPPNSTIARNSRLIDTLGKLHQITLSSGPVAHRARDVEKVLKSVRAPADLTRIALLSHEMMSGLAEDEGVDETYWLAFWTAARRLASVSDPESVVQLTNLADRAQLDGGELLKMNDLREKQQRSSLKH